MKLKVYRSTWGLVDDSDGKKAKVRKRNQSLSPLLIVCLTIISSLFSKYFTVSFPYIWWGSSRIKTAWLWWGGGKKYRNLNQIWDIIRKAFSKQRFNFFIIYCFLPFRFRWNSFCMTERISLKSFLKTLD